jgi:hypothetical protein
MTASLIRQNEVDIGSQAVSYDYTGWMDIAKANIDSQRLNFNFSSENVGRYDEYKANADKYFALSGQEYKNAIDFTVPLSDQYKKFDSVILQKRLQGESGYDEVRTSDEINEILYQKARDAQANAEDVAARADPDTWTFSAELAGGVVGWLSDPVQLGGAAVASIPGALYGVGATAAATITRTVFLEGISEALLETGLQASAVIPWQQELGNEYGWDEALVQIGMAGILAGGFVGGGFAINKAFGGKVPTSAIFDAHQELLRKQMLESNRLLDSELLEAHYRNVDAMGEAFRSGETPRIIADARVADNPFDDDFVTHDHIVVVRDKPDLVDLDAHAKDVFIRQVTEELKSDQTLKRAKDLKSQTASLKALEIELADVRKQIKTGRLELKTFSDLPADPFMADRIAKLEDKVGPLNRERIGLLDKKEANLKAAIKKKEDVINMTEAATRADEDLLQLSAGGIPPRLDARYKTYQKSVKAAEKEYLSWQNRVEEFAKDVFKEGEFVGPPTQRLMDAMNSFVGPIPRGRDIPIRTMKELKDDAPKVEASVNHAFDVEVKNSLTGDSNELFDFVDIDGNEVRLSAADMDGTIKEEMDLMDFWKSCLGIGK